MMTYEEIYDDICVIQFVDKISMFIITLLCYPNKPFTKCRNKLVLRNL